MTAMGLLELDLTRPRRVKAVGIAVCAALIVVIVVVLALVTGRVAVLWVALAAVPFVVAGVLWLYADRAALAAEQRGQDPRTVDDPN